jgi:hypothetical protein
LADLHIVRVCRFNAQSDTGRNAGGDTGRHSAADTDTGADTRCDTGADTCRRTNSGSDTDSPGLLRFREWQ